MSSVDPFVFPKTVIYKTRWSFFLASEDSSEPIVTKLTQPSIGFKPARFVTTSTLSKGRARYTNAKAQTLQGGSPDVQIVVNVELFILEYNAEDVGTVLFHELFHVHGIHGTTVGDDDLYYQVSNSEILNNCISKVEW